MHGITAWELAPDRKRRVWRWILIAAVLVVASLIAGSVVFSFLSSLPTASRSATAASDASQDEHQGVPHAHIRF
jgi:uncharacterized BrkB/YihY/UPF0761 family membrane protein